MRTPSEAVGFVAGQVFMAFLTAALFAFDIAGVSGRIFGYELGPGWLGLITFVAFAVLAALHQWRLWRAYDPHRRARLAVAALTPLAVNGKEHAAKATLFVSGMEPSAAQVRREEEREVWIASWHQECLAAVREHCPAYEAAWVTSQGDSERVELLFDAIKTIGDRT